MKHRSILAFALLAAALFAAPQIAHDLVSFKSAVGARIRGEIVHAFFSLGKGEDSQVLTAQRAATLPLVCTSVNAKTQAAPRPKKTESPVPAHTDASTRRSDAGQLAMLISPSLMLEAADEKTSEFNGNVFDRNMVGKSLELSRRAPAQDTLAMLVLPDAEVAAHAPGRARAVSRSERIRASKSEMDAEAQRQLSRLPASAHDKRIDSQVSDVLIMRELAAANPAANEFRVDGGAPRMKFVKVRRYSLNNNTIPIIYTWKGEKNATALTVSQAPPAE